MGGRRRSPLGLLAASAVVVAACSGGAASGDTGTASSPPSLPPSAPTLQAAALDRAEVLCDRRVAAPDPDAAARYDQETWTDVVELVGHAPIAAPGDAAAGAAARAAVVRSWAAEPELAEGGWARSGTGTVACEDGQLYVVTALARLPAAVPRVPLLARDDVDVVEAVQYRTARDVTGAPIPLLLDIASPPATGTARRPAVVLIHGGGYTGGSRASHAADALAYARRGFVAVTVDYRLDPAAGTSAEAHGAAVRAALDDLRGAVRWLRAHAEQLHVDPERIAALGVSAGGEIALGLALLDDPARGRGPGVGSSAVAAAVSTGAFLTRGLGDARLADHEPPVLLHFFETDTASGRPWTYAAATCDAVRAAGSTCDLDISPGSDHTVGLGPAGPLGPRISAFLAVHLARGDR